MPAAHHDPRDPPGALAVGDHHDRELAQQRVERLAEAQLVLALRGDAHAAGPGAHQDRGVVGRELPVHRCAVERALHAHPNSRSAVSAGKRGVGLDEAQHRREPRRDHPRALALGVQPDRPRRQLDLQARPLLERVGGLDRLLEVPVAVAAQPRAGVEDALQHRVHRQVVADAAGRGERDLGRIHPHGESRGALRLGGIVEAAPAGGGVRAPGVGEHRAQGVQLTALLADEHRRRRGARRGEARRADGALGVAHQQAQVGVAAGLDPAGHPGRAEAGGQPGARSEVAHVRGRRDPARVEERLRRPWAARSPPAWRSPTAWPRSQQPPRSRRMENITLRFWTACEEVPFQRLSIAENTSSLPVCSSDAAKIRQ